jgi:hypothetical protein
MALRPLRLPAAAPVPRIVLLRRRQQVVVRAAVATGPTVLRPPRPTSKTLVGLGAEERAFREAADTWPALSRASTLDETPPPVSGVRMKEAPVERVTLEDLTPRPRPVTLIDGVHDRQSHDYLEEAKRLLASGIFDVPDEG